MLQLVAFLAVLAQSNFQFSLHFTNCQVVGNELIAGVALATGDFGSVSLQVTNSIIEGNTVSMSWSCPCSLRPRRYCPVGAQPASQ